MILADIFYDFYIVHNNHRDYYIKVFTFTVDISKYLYYNICREVKEMRNPDLKSIIDEMKKGEDFELTAEQYKQKTTADFPKNKYYAKNNSAAARAAKQCGFYIEVVPKKILFKKKKGE